MKILARLMLVFALVTTVLAQQPEKGPTDQPQKKDSTAHDSAQSDNVYKLVFLVYELQDGKRTNQRDYMMMAKSSGHPASIRIGTRVPIYAEEKKMQYVDAGLDIRCFVGDVAGGRVLADCEIGVSSFIQAEQAGGSANVAPSAPVLRSTRTNSSSLLVLGKPTLIATVDDVNSTKRMQIEVTATKVD